MIRYYYKTKDNTGWLNLKTPDYDSVKGYVRITEQEWNEHIAELEAEHQVEE